uniref:(California timema) hypothetical protein n=1 Tax=Timema californicum TaxID=61474 RepID=A0A7R9JAA0_TIMCA|nr:unnamed protein product [Timema californicum]
MKTFVVIIAAKGERMSYQDYMSFRRCFEGKHSLLDLSSSELLLDDLETYYVLCSKQNPGEMISNFEDFVKRRSSMEGTSMGVITANICLRIMEAILFGHKPRLKKRIINISMEVDKKTEQPLLLNCHQRKMLTRLTALMKLLEDQDRLDMLVFNHKFLTVPDTQNRFKTPSGEGGGALLRLDRVCPTRPSRDLSLVESSLFRLLCSMDGRVVDSVPEVVEIDLTLEMEVCEEHDSVPQGPDLKSLIGSMVRDLMALLLVRGASVRQQSNQICGQVLENISSQILKVLGDAAVNDIDNGISQSEVNWKWLLMTVSVYLRHFPQADKLLKDLVERHLQEAVLKRNLSLLTAVFLLARHCCAAETPLFPSYLTWFAASFGNDSITAASVANYQVLLKFLTGLVPAEPAFCLKVHINKEVYTHLRGKTTLSIPDQDSNLDLPIISSPVSYKSSGLDQAATESGGEHITVTVLTSSAYPGNTTLHDTDAFPCEVCRAESLYDGSNGDRVGENISQSAEEDVTRVLAHYEDTGEIIQLLFDAYLMRRSYFEKHFLPKLLTGRDIPDPPDARARFIEKLFLAGKIPRPAFQKYQKACAEASRNLEAV